MNVLLNVLLNAYFFWCVCTYILHAYILNMPSFCVRVRVYGYGYGYVYGCGCDPSVHVCAVSHPIDLVVEQ